MELIRVEDTVDTPISRKVAEVFARQVNDRCYADSCKLTLRLTLDPTIGFEGFTISDGPNGSTTINGSDERGLVYGVGKFLRDSRYDQGEFTPGKWRGTSVPRLPVRGIYFATHFHNFYHDAPIEQVTRYVEDLALWGINSLMVWYDQHHFNGWDDPKAAEFRERIRLICEAARGVGLGIGFIAIANEGYGNSPVELRSDGTGRGQILPTDICTSKPAGQEYVLRNAAQLYDWAADLKPSYACIWPYDSGGCGCEQCRPWGSNGYLKAAERLAKLIKGKCPNVKIILSVWYLDEAEFEGVAKAFSVKPEWADYLMSEPNTWAFTHESPGRLPILGFPEISMRNMWPWGGFGANPMPNMCERYWNAVKGKSVGGFPYSEGIYEDINKVILAQLYWNPDRPIKEILREYATFEYSPDVVDEALSVIETLEGNHHMRWWPGLFENFTGWFPSKNVELQADHGAEQAYETVKRIDAQLTLQASKSWRWRIIYLRALLDSELKTNGGSPNQTCEDAFNELTDIFFAHNAEIHVKPPTAEASLAFSDSAHITG